MKKFLPRVISVVVATLLITGVSAGTAYIITRRPLVIREAKSAKKGMFSAGEFTTNLAPNEAKTKYIKVRIELEVADEKSLEAMAAQQAVIRDQILGVLRSKTFHDVTGDEGMQALGRAIVVQLNNVLKGTQVTGVYFTEFVVQ
ncbi:MAG: flagellar basal body-associated FliL family protein [Firmicutes bacterium]|nr:flagellar basal body-associated FliL family protein [Bacillota bacterium]